MNHQSEEATPSLLVAPGGEAVSSGYLTPTLPREEPMVTPSPPSLCPPLMAASAWFLVPTIGYSQELGLPKAGSVLSSEALEDLFLPSLVDANKENKHRRATTLQPRLSRTVKAKDMKFPFVTPASESVTAPLFDTEDPPMLRSAYSEDTRSLPFTECQAAPAMPTLLNTLPKAETRTLSTIQISCQHSTLPRKRLFPTERRLAGRPFLISNE